MLCSQEDRNGVKFAGGLVQTRIQAVVVAVESEATPQAKESKAGERRELCRMRRAESPCRWMVLKSPMDCE